MDTKGVLALTFFLLCIACSVQSSSIPMLSLSSRSLTGSVGRSVNAVVLSPSTGSDKRHEQDRIDGQK